MTMAYNKTVAFIILSGALLTQARIQAGEKTPNASAISCAAYCVNLRCWQEAPCSLDHLKDTVTLQPQIQEPKQLVARRPTPAVKWRPATLDVNTSSKGPIIYRLTNYLSPVK